MEKKSCKSIARYSRTKLGQEKDSSFQVEGCGNKAVSLNKYFSGVAEAMKFWLGQSVH